MDFKMLAQHPFIMPGAWRWGRSLPAAPTSQPGAARARRGTAGEGRMEGRKERETAPRAAGEGAGEGVPALFVFPRHRRERQSAGG